MKHKKNDASISILIKGLINLGIPWCKKEDNIIFSFDRTPVQPFIYYNKEGKGYSFKEMVEETNHIARPYLTADYERVIKLLRGISQRIDLLMDEEEEEEEGVGGGAITLKKKGITGITGITDKNNKGITGITGKNKYALITQPCKKELGVSLIVNDEQSEELQSLLKRLREKYEHNTVGGHEVLAAMVQAGVRLDKEERERVQEEDKRMSRSYMTSFSSDKVSVTKIRNNYFVAHLTNADLSMMNDFDLLKEELNIVQKSFITLGKPLRMYNTNIIIRDTLLLAPAGQKSLEAIGSMYGDNSRKITLSRNQKENMDILLMENRELFESYALRDAIITLVHSNHMEDFNFKLNGVGIPVTLSSLGTQYVKNS
jgi:hypothetical protein